MPSIGRYISHIKNTGLKGWYRQMWGIGDAKYGRLVGTDQFGNKYFENTEDEVPDYAQHDFAATQVPPEWHSWIHHIRKDAPSEDPIVQASSPPWKAEYIENLSGTRGRYITYSTTVPKVREWDPVVKPRGSVKA